MALQIQILQDAPPEVDHAPLMELMQWLREHASRVPRNMGFYLPYDNSETGCCIVDLGHMIQGLEEWQDPVFNFGDAKAGIPPPPDIREYLQKEITAGRCFAWVSW